MEGQQQHSSLSSLTQRTSKRSKSSRASNLGSEHSHISTASRSRRERGAHSSSSSSSSALAPSLVKRWLTHLSSTGALPLLGPCSVALFVLLVKSAVGLGPYSGQGVGTMRGDFEAQRHWMEITTGLPLKEWYYYDLPYWGLDYPPLTAYHSYLLGLLGSYLSPAWFALDTSRGNENLSLKAYMRAAVLVGDVAVYWSAVWAWIWWDGARQDGRSSSSSSSSSQRRKLQHFLFIILQPSLILIDSGHFQFNSIMLGLALWTLVLLREGRDALACVAFVSCLAFKQMGLFWAPAIGVWLLGKCYNLGWKDGSQLFFKLAWTTSATFGVLLAPFAFPLSGLGQVAHRVFPFARGLFEDKVANFWCASNVVIKWRALVPASALPPLALALTFLALLPSLLPALHLFVTLPRATPPRALARLLPLMTWNSAVAFFLFGFQVHEKTVLVPLLGLMAAARFDGAEGGDGPDPWMLFVNNVATFSLWPLLQKDKLGLQYVVLNFVLNWLFGVGASFARTLATLLPRSGVGRYIAMIGYPAMAALHLAELVLPPPASKPDLYPVLNAVGCCGILAYAWLRGLREQLEVGWDLSVVAQGLEKERLRAAGGKEDPSSLGGGER